MVHHTPADLPSPQSRHTVSNFLNCDFSRPRIWSAFLENFLVCRADYLSPLPQLCKDLPVSSPHSRHLIPWSSQTPHLVKPSPYILSIYRSSLPRCAKTSQRPAPTAATAVSYSLMVLFNEFPLLTNQLQQANLFLSPLPDVQRPPNVQPPQPPLHPGRHHSTPQVPLRPSLPPLFPGVPTQCDQHPLLARRRAQCREHFPAVWGIALCHFVPPGRAEKRHASVGPVCGAVQDSDGAAGGGEGRV